MKELKLLTEWAEKITEAPSFDTPKRLGTPMTSKADRPLPRHIDIQYKAQRAHPELSPEQALALYMSDELVDKEKMDFSQNKLINRVRSENDKLTRTVKELGDELHDFEQQSHQTDQEVERLKALSAKLKPAGEVTKQVAQATSQQIEKMMKEVDNLRLKPGMSPDKQKELEQKINDIKAGGLSSAEVKNIHDTIETLSTKQDIDDIMFDKVMGELEKTQLQLQKKEERFQQSKNRNDAMRDSWGTKFRELNKTIELISQKTAKADAAADELDSKLKKLEIMEPTLQKLTAKSLEEPAETPTQSEYPEFTQQQSTAIQQQPNSNNISQDWQDLVSTYEKERELAGHAAGASEPIALEPEEEQQMPIKEDLSKYSQYPKFIAWANQFRPVVMKMFRNKFHDDEDMYPDDALGDAIDEYMVYLKNADQITKPMMDKVLDLVKRDLDSMASTMATGKIPKQQDLFKDPQNRPSEPNYRPDYEWPPRAGQFSESLMKDFEKNLSKLTGGY